MPCYRAKMPYEIDEEIEKNSSYANKIRDELDKTTAFLCEAIYIIRQYGLQDNLSKELNQWHILHKQDDNDRLRPLVAEFLQSHDMNKFEMELVEDIINLARQNK